MSCACERPVVVTDPRHAGYCGRCGRRIPDTVPAVAEPHTYPRDRMYEQSFAHAAGHHAGLAAHAAMLRELADKRTMPGGLRRTADWRAETIEELADALNYLTWRCQQTQADELGPAYDEHLALVEAAGHIVRAYALIA